MQTSLRSPVPGGIRSKIQTTTPRVTTTHCKRRRRSHLLIQNRMAQQVVVVAMECLKNPSSISVGRRGCVTGHAQVKMVNMQAGCRTRRTVRDRDHRPGSAKDRVGLLHKGCLLAQPEDAVIVWPTAIHQLLVQNTVCGTKMSRTYSTRIRILATPLDCAAIQQDQRQKTPPRHWLLSLFCLCPCLNPFFRCIHPTPWTR